MRRIALLVTVLLLAAPGAEAGKKKPKAGNIKNSVYVDNDYEFKLTIHDNWKAKVQKVKKDKHGFRLILSQKKWSIPAIYVKAQDYTKIPRLVLYADTCSVGVYPFIDSLLSETYKTDRKKYVATEFEFLSEPDIIPTGRSGVEIDSERGVLWKGKSKYVKEIQESAGSSAAERVYGAYGGAIYAFKKDNLLVMLHLMCEWEYFDQVLAEVNEIITSFQWAEEEEKS